jgi:PAS domain-containing protein
VIIILFAVEWEAIEKAIIAISRQARQAVWISEVGSITTIILASVVIVLLLRRLNRSGLAAIQALAAEEATRLAYNELNQIFNTATDGIRVIDRNFNMIRVNETFSRMSGINEAEVLGKKCFAVFHGPVCNTPGCPLTRVLNGEERIEFDVNNYQRPCLADLIISAGTEEISNLYSIYGKSSLLPEGLHSEKWFRSLNSKRQYISIDAAPIYNQKGELIAVMQDWMAGVYGLIKSFVI